MRKEQIPHNPSAFDSNRAAMVGRRNLPHWRQDGALYFVTFRLADSLPAERRAEWAQLRGTGFQPVDLEGTTGKMPVPHATGKMPVPREMREDAGAIEFLERVDRWLDAGHGACCLARPAAADIVESALRFFDGQRYELGPYVVMPNHVHVLVVPAGGHELSRILHSWKSFTAKQINKALGRDGALWQDESFDHIVRSDESAQRFAAYIEQNASAAPAGKARLGRGGLSM